MCTVLATYVCLRAQYVVAAGFGNKVSLRTFHEVLPDKTRVPFAHTPVPPLVTFIHGVRTVAVDKAWLEADVEPDDGAADGDDFAYSSDYDDDERPPRAFEAMQTPPRRAAAAQRAAEEEAAAVDMASWPPCTQCGMPLHISGDCHVFGRPRGASHSPEAAALGIHRDIGDDGSRCGVRNADVEVRTVDPSPDSLYEALTLAVRGLGANFLTARPVTRAGLCTWIRRNGDQQVAGQMLRDWVAFETDKGWRQVSSYAEWMEQPDSWAGPIDIAAFAAMRSMRIDVWRSAPATDSFVRHASFYPAAGPSTLYILNLLHARGRHYDVLRIQSRRSPVARLRLLAPAPCHCLLSPQARRGPRLSARHRLRPRPVRTSRRALRRLPRRVTTLRTSRPTCACAHHCHIGAAWTGWKPTRPSHPASPLSCKRSGCLTAASCCLRRTQTRRAPSSC